MAETIRWCEVHGYQSFDGVDGSSCEDGVWLEGRGGWNCREVVRILSAPGELVDPANVDYEAAAKHFCEVTHPELVKKPCEGHLEWVFDLVGLALGVGEPAEGSE